MAGRCLLIDVGGGSCEVSLSDRKRIVETVSLPLGAVRLTEEFLKTDPPTKDEIARMKKLIARELRRASRRIDSASADGHCHFGHGGGPLGGEQSGAQDSWRGARIFYAGWRHSKIREQADEDEQHGAKRRRRHRAAPFGDHSGRCARVLRVAGAFRAAGASFSDMGLRDGILAQMLAESDARTSAHQQYERDRWEAVLEICRRYGVDLKLAEPVRAHAAQLFRDLAAIHELPPEYQPWLEAAAMMRTSANT